MSPGDERGRPPTDRPATYVHHDVADSVPLSHDMSPAMAYWRGLQDGARMARERYEAADDRAHRSAVKAASQAIKAIDRREGADRGEMACCPACTQWWWRGRERHDCPVARRAVAA